MSSIKLEFHIAGALRYTKHGNMVAAGAACLTTPDGENLKYTHNILDHDFLTYDHTEWQALNTALSIAQQRYQVSPKPAVLEVKICYSSKHLDDCLHEFVAEWLRNGWKGRDGMEVVERPLIEQTMALKSWVEDNGDLSFEWISDAENEVAISAADLAVQQAERNGWY